MCLVSPVAMKPQIRRWQILHLNVDCSDFDLIRDRGSLPYLPILSHM